MATKTTLASAIRSAGKYAIKDASAVKSPESSNYANSRVTVTGSNVSPNLSKVAQMGGGTNTMTTSPNFYSPFLTPSSFQIPN